MGALELGPHLSMGWRDDPKRLAFTFARYKFVAKMLNGKHSVLEIGCGDGFATRIVAQSVRSVVGISIDAHELPQDSENMRFLLHDILSDKRIANGAVFDGAYSLDCLEHIRPDDTDRFIRAVKACTKGPFIVGMPSLESQQYASPRSKAGHINCMTQDQLRDKMREHFSEVFMFGMNDEVLHTGFGPMCQYLLAIGV